MQIFGAPVSPYVRKVMVACAEKGLESTVVPVNPRDPSPEFIAASPYRKIPAYTDGDFAIADSTAIVTYLEAQYPAPALLPADPRARARAIWFEEVADTILLPAAGPILFNRFVGPTFMGVDGDEAAAVAAEGVLAEKLAYIETEAAKGEWLDGEYSIADISIACVLRSLAYAGWQVDADAFPAIAAWYGRVCARPAWAAAAVQEEAAMAAMAG